MGTRLGFKVGAFCEMKMFGYLCWARFAPDVSRWAIYHPLIMSFTIKVSFVLFKRLKLQPLMLKHGDSLKSDVNFIKILPKIRVELTPLNEF